MRLKFGETSKSPNNLLFRLAIVCPPKYCEKLEFSVGEQNNKFIAD